MMTQYRLELPLAEIVNDRAPLREIAFELVRDQKAKGHFLRLLQAARASRPGNPKLAKFAEMFELAMQTPPAPELERIIEDTNSFLDLAQWRERLAEIEARVCRIEVTTNAGIGYGTGFLVGPDLVLTNYHVVDAVIAGEKNEFTPDGRRAKKNDVVLRFDYRHVKGTAKPTPGTEVRLADVVDFTPFSQVDFEPLPKSADPPADQLDYALLRLESRGSKPFANRPIGDTPEPDAPPRGTIPIPAADWVFTPRTPLFIVQHPDSQPIKLALDTDAVKDVNGNKTRVTYRTNTLGGSSGSPCFNQHLELVALHHAGDPKYAPLYHPEFNEGVPIAAVREQLRARGTIQGVTVS